MKQVRKLLALLLAVMLVFSLAACSRGGNEGSEPNASNEAQIPEDGSTLGTGSTTFTFQAKLKDGTQYTYTIQTEETTVGKALLDLGLISGEDGEYGLYVKTVLGETLDYEADGYWWSFLVDGESSMTGVDQTQITAGSTYALEATPA